jgi:hypothetical protein
MTAPCSSRTVCTRLAWHSQNATPNTSTNNAPSFATRTAGIPPAVLVTTRAVMRWSLQSYHSCCPSAAPRCSQALSCAPVPSGPQLRPGAVRPSAAPRCSQALSCAPVPSGPQLRPGAVRPSAAPRCRQALSCAPVPSGIPSPDKAQNRKNRPLWGKIRPF